MRQFAKLALMSVVVMAGSLASRAEEWPQWRGPNGDNIVRDEKLAAKWPADGPKQLWSLKAGLGYASPVAVNGRIYAFAVTGPRDNASDVLYCLEPDTGKIIWKQSYPGAYMGNYPGTRAAPTIVGDRIYTYGGNGDLVGRNLEDGKELWHINVLKETGSENLTWAVASCPLVIDGRIYVQSGKNGNFCVAVDAGTGKIIWKSAKGLGGYAHIIQIDAGGTKQLVVFGGDTIYGLKPSDGTTIWSHPWKTNWDVNASTPVYADGHLFITSDYDHGCIMFKVSPTGVEKVFENKEVMTRFQGAILDDGKLYSNTEGTIKCLQWPTDKVLWSERTPRLGMGGAILRIPGKRFIALSDRGNLYLVQETDNGLKVISEKRYAVEGKEVWSTPLVYRGKVYIKGAEDLICFDIGAK